MNLKKLSCAALLVLLIEANFAFANDDQPSRKSLAGLKGVTVLVEDIRPEAEDQGLTITAVQTDAELRLRKAGIRVFTDAEIRNVPGNPVLYLKAIVMPGKPGWGYAASIELHQGVILTRDPSMETWACTWSVAGGGGYDEPSNIARKVRDKLNDYVDQFINAYLAMNQKKQTP
jgi:hypothetical protein